MLATISNGISVPFDDIRPASFFKPVTSNNIFIKLDKEYSQEGGIKANAINIKNGSLDFFLSCSECFVFDSNKTVLTIRNIEFNIKNPFTNTEEFYLDQKDAKINGNRFKSFFTYFDKLKDGAVFTTYNKELPWDELFLKLNHSDINKIKYVKNNYDNNNYEDDCEDEDKSIYYKAVNLYTGELRHIEDFSVPVCDFTENIIIDFNQSAY